MLATFFSGILRESSTYTFRINLNLPKYSDFSNEPNLLKINFDHKGNKIDDLIKIAQILKESTGEISEFHGKKKQPSTDINDLSNELLMEIFSHLKLETLFEIERASKRWKSILCKNFWKQYEVLILDDVFVRDSFNDEFEDLHSQVQCDSLFKIFKRLMKRISKERVKYLDMSYLAPYLVQYESYCLDLISRRCPNLTYLNLDNFKIFRNSKIQFRNMIASVGNLRTLSVRNSLLRDKHLSYIFAKCPNLETLDLAWCKKLEGYSFQDMPITCRNLNLNACISFDIDRLVNLIMNNPQLTRLHVKHTSQHDFEILDSIIHFLPNLEALQIAVNLDDALNLLELSKMNLQYLNLKGSVCDSDSLSVVLNACLSLKTLILDSCLRVNDEAFCKRPIRAPLENLVLSKLCDLTDRTLIALEQLSTTLERLDIDKCKSLSYTRVNSLFSTFRSLKFLNLNKLPFVDNLILAKELSENIHGQNYISCVKTGVDFKAFCIDYPHYYSIDFDKRGLVKIKYTNLIILTNYF
jgi:hypothetical protein